MIVISCRHKFIRKMVLIINLNHVLITCTCIKVGSIRTDSYTLFIGIFITEFGTQSFYFIKSSTVKVSGDLRSFSEILLIALANKLIFSKILRPGLYLMSVNLYISTQTFKNNWLSMKLCSYKYNFFADSTVSYIFQLNQLYLTNIIWLKSYFIEMQWN